MAASRILASATLGCLSPNLASCFDNVACAEDTLLGQRLQLGAAQKLRHKRICYKDCKLRISVGILYRNQICARVARYRQAGATTSWQPHHPDLREGWLRWPKNLASSDGLSLTRVADARARVVPRPGAPAGKTPAGATASRSPAPGPSPMGAALCCCHPWQPCSEPANYSADVSLSRVPRGHYEYGNDPKRKCCGDDR